MSGTGNPELRIDGYVNDAKVLSRLFSSDRSSDQFCAQADDKELQGDGSDATRLEFGVFDKFGVPRAFAKGEVSLAIEGPGVIVGDNPFQLEDSGGSGAVWIRTLPGQSGQIKVEATHSVLGKAPVKISVAENRGSPV